MMRDLRKLRETFPLLYAEFPKEFGMLFNAEGHMTRAGHVLNQHIKDVRKQRMSRKK